MDPARAPSVFISYSHDSATHRQRVLGLANQLRTDGLDVRLDQYVESPPTGWTHWTERQVVDCDFVLMVCTAIFRERFDRGDTGGAGKGVKWEALIVQQLLYEAGTINDKLIPVWFDEGSDVDVPLSMRAYTRYSLPSGYDKLYRRLTGQPEILVPPIGKIRPMPPAPSPGLAGAAVSGGTSSSSPKDPVVAAAVEITEQTLIDELARVLFDGDQARLVAQRAGFSPAHIPAFRMPLVFWTTVIEAARNGAIVGGAQAVADAAAKLYPGNAVLGGYRSRSR